MDFIRRWLAAGLVLVAIGCVTDLYYVTLIPEAPATRTDSIDALRRCLREAGFEREPSESIEFWRGKELSATVHEGGANLVVRFFPGPGRSPKPDVPQAFAGCVSSSATPHAYELRRRTEWDPR